MRFDTKISPYNADFPATLSVVTSKLPLYEAHILTPASNFVLLQPY